MGKIKRLAIDSMILIYLLEGNERFSQKITAILDKAEQIFVSTLGIAEVLTGLEKQRDKLGKLRFLAFLESYQKLSVVSFGKQEALAFAELRAKYPSVKAPDAIHLATALSARAEVFLTNDKALEQVEEIEVLLL